MSPRYLNDERRNKGKKVPYLITVKHRGELSEAFLRLLKDNLWEFFGDISRDDITIKRINNGGK